MFLSPKEHKVQITQEQVSQKVCDNFKILLKSEKHIRKEQEDGISKVMALFLIRMIGVAIIGVRFYT